MKEIGSGVVSAVKRAGKDAFALSLALDGGETVALTVPPSLYERIGAPEVGARLSDAALSELVHESEYLSACRHALRILEYGDNNAKTLRDKLVRKGISREVAGEAVEKMVSLGYIREGEQARRLAVGYARRNLWGPRKIVSALTAKGYSREDAETAVRDAEALGEIDFREVRKNLVKRCQSRGLAPEKIRAALWRYGFGSEE
ncbi:MAG: RecX family transcriptional regulator [Clostridia bacterium]|nr:RecX family transcriptional regulator [Clostridia bacterium]